jgi:thiamine biosynthesis lipoprotein
MILHQTVPASTSFRALGTTVTVLTTDPHALPLAEGALRKELAAIDLACSRFRPDSELSRLNARAGTPTSVSPLLAEAVEVALRAAELTDGAVDPTVGRSVVALGYDRSFASLRPENAEPAPAAVPAPGWRTIDWKPVERRIVIPPHTALDLGATAKALAADRAARHAAEAAGCGILVNLGGDLATAGDPPTGGWVVGLADDHADDRPGPAVTITSGALASSGITVRRWQRNGKNHHHIVDPATGRSTEPYWCTVTVAAGTCVDANTASTAAVVLGREAIDWLPGTGLPARLVHVDGSLLRLSGWPHETTVTAAGPR